MVHAWIGGHKGGGRPYGLMAHKLMSLGICKIPGCHETAGASTTRHPHAAHRGRVSAQCMFSFTLLSLYVMAHSSPDNMRKSLVTPGCPASWQMAAKSDANCSNSEKGVAPRTRCKAFAGTGGPAQPKYPHAPAHLCRHSLCALQSPETEARNACRPCLLKHPAGSKFILAARQLLIAFRIFDSEIP